MKTKFGQNIDLEKKGIIFGQVMERFASVIDAESTLTIDGMFGYVISEGIYLNIQGVVTKIAPSIDNLTKSTAFYSATEPTSGVVTGVLWFDTGESKLKIFNGSIWVTITPDAGTLLTIEQINDINNIANKLDKGSYTGNASDLFDLASSKVSNTQPSGDANRRFIINADGSVTLGLNVVSTLQSTTDSGSETTNKITSNRLEGSVGFEVNSTGSTVLKTSISNESYDIENETLGLRTKIKSNGISFTTYTNNANGLDILVPTSNVMNSGRHTITYPYASGEIALKSNVEERVPYTGAVNDVDLGDNFIKLGKRGSKSSKNEFITYLKDSVLDSDVFRRQDRIWNGTTFIDVNHSYLIGEGSGLNNTGRRLLSYGRNSGTNNTGNYSILIGYSAGLNNTGTDLLAIGHNSALNNTSTYSVFIGNNSGLNNIGGNAVGVGYSSLSNNTGNSATALGYNALQNNTGNSSSGIGHIVMQHNTGSNSNGFGLKSLQHNSGHISNGFGVYSLQYNKANGAVGVGGYSLQNNTGVDSVGLGLYSLNFNNGDKSLGLGSYSLRYNDGVGNIAIGDNAWSNFIEDVPNIKTFSNTDVNDSLKRFTITGHGFGSVGSTINLKFKVVSGSSSVNMSNNSVYQFKVIDNDTLEIANSIVVSSITFNNVGSYTFTPQTVFTNSISLGSNSQPTKSNQVVLGDDNIVEVYSKGVFKTGAEIADITDNKHLVTLEKLNSVGVPYTGAINDVDLGSHTIKLGREEVILNKAKHQISLLDNIGSPLFRRQTHYWNSTTSQFSTTQGNGFGYNSLQNNIAQQSNGFGDFSLQNNTGQQSNGFGLNALQNNTGTYSSGFGNDSLRYNTGAYSSGFGHQTLRNNTGAYATGVGYNSLRDNKGGNNSAFGSFSLRRSENNMNSAFGFGTLQDLTIGTNNNAFGALASSESNNVTKTNSFGTFALAKNTGSNVVGIGDYSGYSNNGSYVVGVGSTSVRNNFGSHVVGIGLDSGYFNIGDKNIGVGYRTNYLTQGSENVAIGFGSNSEFIDDVSKEITFTSTNVDFTNNRITLTNHNLGSTNSIVLLRYINVSGSTIGGIFNNGYFSFKIIDINTIEIVNYNITNQGSDNHKLVPSIVFNNTVSLGSNSQPTKSNQVVLGDDNIVEVYSKGVFKTGAEIADITDNKHLVTLEKLNSVGVPYTGATNDVNLGNHTIELGKEEVITDKAKHEISLLDNNGRPLFRKQTHYWNGISFSTTNGSGFGIDSLMNNIGYSSCAFGSYSLRNNTGYESNGFGYFALDNNTGSRSNGFGYFSLQNNTGNNSNGFGFHSLKNNTGGFSSGFGNSALSGNTGNNSNGFGYLSLSSNTGNNASGFGHASLLQNTGFNSSGFGYSVLQFNTGNNSNGFGYISLQKNKGTSSNGFGNYSLELNDGIYSNGFGHNSLRYNNGDESNGFGHSSLIRNIGSDSNGFGNNSLRYNQGSNNSGFGHNSYSVFDENVTNKKGFTNTDIDSVNKRINITSHGFGAINSIVNLKYILVSGGSIALGNNDIYTFKIIDNDTIEILYNGIVGTNVGTHELIPQNTFNNTTSLGYGSQPTKSNQVVLGNSLTDEVFSEGNFKSNAPKSSIIDPKHLVTVEYVEDLPKDSNFAIVKLGSISHIPEFGSLDKHFNSISDVFDKIASSANKYDDVGFKIYLIGTGTFSLTTSTTYHFKDISIISRDENILELNSEIRLDNPVLDMTSTTLNMLAPNKIMFKGNVKMNLKKFDLIGTNTTFFTPLSFLYYTDHSSRISEIDINISEYVFNGNIGATGVLGCSGYNKVNLNINKLTIIKDTSWSYLFGFSSTLESISNVNINIGHIDALTSNGNIVMFNATGLSAADMKTNNFKPNRGGTINLKVGDINAPNASDFRMFNGVRSGLYNVDINGNINCPPFKLFLHPSLLYGMEFNLTGNIESNHFGYLVDGYDQTKLPATDVETCIINIKDFKVKSSDVFGQLLRTRSHVSQSLSVDVVPVPIIVENVTFDTQSAKIGVVQGSLTVDDPLTKPMIEFKGINKFTMVSSTHLLQINDGDLNMLNANPSIILNSGKIQHNATNADYTDERAMVTKESKYTHEI